MNSFKSILRYLDVSGADSFTSHCFRRGAAVDILESHGLSAMLRFGQWSSPQAATPYASADEQAAMDLALADHSDEDHSG